MGGGLGLGGGGKGVRGKWTFFYFESKFKIFFLVWRVGGWRGARISIFFSKNPNLKKKIFFFTKTPNRK